LAIKVESADSSILIAIRGATLAWRSSASGSGRRLVLFCCPVVSLPHGRAPVLRVAPLTPPPPRHELMAHERGDAN